MRRDDKTPKQSMIATPTQHRNKKKMNEMNDKNEMNEMSEQQKAVTSTQHFVCE